MRAFLAYGLSKEGESLFRQHWLPFDRKQALISMLILMVPVIVFSAGDFKLLEWNGPLFLLPSLRVAVLAMTAGLAVFIRRSSSWRRYDLAVTLWSCLTLAAVMIINYLRLHNITEHAVFDAVIIMLIYLVVPNRLTIQTLIAVLFTVCEIVVLWLKLDPASMLPLYTSILAFVAANLACFAVSWQLNSSRRRDFRVHMEGQRARDELKKLAEIDDLTGVYNSRVFHAMIADEMLRFRRYGRPLSFVMLDMDHFKLVNDNHGHIMGDRVLREVAGVIRSQLRQVDILGRMGGEELGILLPETDVEDGIRAADRVREALEKMYIALDNGGELRVTASFGVTTVKETDTGMDPVIARADKALYLAKDNGRNRVESML